MPQLPPSGRPRGRWSAFIQSSVLPAPVALATVVLLGISGCGDDGGSTDGGGTDGSPPFDGDISRPDAGGLDAGPPRDCGDAICTGGETCASCETDCGACMDAIMAASCGRDDVATAIASAMDGSTVVIPPGTCSWTSGVAIAGKGIHVTGMAPGAVTLVHDGGAESLFDITEDTTHHVEISNLRFDQGSGGAEAWQGMYVHVGGTAGGRPVLIHDNHFDLRSSARRAIRFEVSRGVLFSCTFDAHLEDASGIVILGDDDSWTTPPTMGAADVLGESNLYIEDNTFTHFPAQCLDPDSNSRVVIRHNTFDHSAMASHGADTSEVGTRHWELYDNTLVWVDRGDCDGSMTIGLPYFFYIRGGTGVIANNVIPDMRSCAWGDKAEVLMTVQNIRRNAGPYPCWDTYPAPHQIGQGNDGTMDVLDPVYLWGNTGGGNYDDPGIADYDPDECAAGRMTTDFIRAGRDFYVAEMKPGYAKFTYPHPLRVGR